MANLLKMLRYPLFARYYRLREFISPSKIKSDKDIPIIINNFNRLTTLLKLINSLSERGYDNIYIIDNNSTYPPLLEYYEKCPYKIFRLKQNLGYKALWKSGLSKQFCNDYYIYTDSDVVPVNECPVDFINTIFTLLKKYKYAYKIGLSLRIDNLPDHYIFKQKVIKAEKKDFLIKNKDGLYRRPTDTTFAIYRPRVKLSRSRYAEAYRTAFPYEVEHLPWYIDTENPTEEEIYYNQHCSKPTTWSSKNK